MLNPINWEILEEESLIQNRIRSARTNFFFGKKFPDKFP